MSANVAKNTSFRILCFALHTSRSQALPRTQNKTSLTFAGNSKAMRQIPFTLSPIQFRLLSIYVLGIYVLEHKAYLEKNTAYKMIAIAEMK